MAIDGVQGNSLNITGNGDISITNLKENQNGTFHADGIYVEGNIEGHNLTIKTTVEGAKGINAYDTNINNGIDGVKINLTGDLKIYSDSDGIFATQDNKNDITIKANSVYIKCDNRTGILNAGNVSLASIASEKENFINITSQEDITIISSQGTASGDTYAGVRNRNKGTTTLTSTSGNISIDASENYNGIYADVGNVNVIANNGKVEIKGKTVGVNVKGSEVTEDTTVYISADAIEVFAGDFSNINYKTRSKESLFGDEIAASAENGGKSIFATNSNVLHGAAFASGSDSLVLLSGYKKGLALSDANKIYSSAIIEDAGDFQSSDAEDNKFKETQVISALYAEEGASITLNGKENIIRTKIDPSSSILERAVWAYNGNGNSTIIDINGYTDIATDSYEQSFIGESLNSKDVAVAAGTAVGLTYDTVVNYSDEEGRATVDIAYADKENGEKSTITGDVLSAYAGLIEIKPEDKAKSTAGINIRGNLLAGNNGILNVDLGNSGSLTGRVDDYGDAGNDGEDDKGHASYTFFDPTFSSTIYKGGEVNLTMGKDSSWDVTGQSWITSVNTNFQGTTPDSVAGVPMINLTTANTDLNSAGNALTIGKFNGDAVFTMNLDGKNVPNGNMLYMKEANGTYYINLVKAVSEDEINTAEHNGLRFATVGENSNVTFHVGTKNRGVFNVEYEVGTDNYDDKSVQNENSLYNGETLGGQKPGNDAVGDFFTTDETTRAKTPAVMALAALTEDNAVDENITEEQDQDYADAVTNAENHKIIAVKSREVSDGGKTIINMSRANYANAVYMDTLNKRQGEARFVGDTDHGVWVRLRHDNIGKEDAFRSHNTMVEVGIDQRDVHDYGEFHTGVALDYMNSSLDYHTVDGDGDIERYGIWFYTTYLGNDGQYADLILKYGHLKNDFGFNTKTQGEHVTGDYTNETASISAEYGWKFSNSHNYYIEPQAQLQYTYITGADYTTSQGSRVDLDSIHSLIGRVGFRAGKDFLDWEHPASFYLRADALHEFLGDQDIRAYDNTGVMDITYENDDTWYTVGLGMTVKSSDNTYFFIEGETALGADNEDTYTVSGGFRHSF